MALNTLIWHNLSSQNVNFHVQKIPFWDLFFYLFSISQKCGNPQKQLIGTELK